MTEDFKKRTCELAGLDIQECPETCNSDPDKMCYECTGGDFWDDYEVTLETLVLAMWEINETFEMNYLIKMDVYNYYIVEDRDHKFLYKSKCSCIKQKALEAVLQYIYEQEQKSDG